MYCRYHEFQRLYKINRMKIHVDVMIINFCDQIDPVQNNHINVYYKVIGFFLI